MTDKHLLVEKYVDGCLTEEEQNYIVSECETNEEFRVFWRESLKDVAVADSIKGSSETEAFLSTALFLDRKISKRRKKKSPFIQFLKIAAVLALAGVGYSFAMTLKSVYPGKVVYSTEPTYKSDQKLTYGLQKLDQGVLHVDFKGNQLIFEGPAKFTLNNRSGLHLEKGRVYIDASKSSGLKTHVNGHLYEDIGTKFGVDAGNGSEVHVFEGKVKSGSDEVVAGSAIQVRNGKTKSLKLKRGAFISPELLGKMDKSRSYYLKSQEDLLNYDGLVNYYDLMNLKNSFSSDLEKQGVKVSGTSIVSGPCAGSTALLFSDGDKLEIPVPKGDFTLVFEYYYEEFTSNGQLIMKSNTNQMKVNQSMSWFKKEYWDKENNTMGEKFYRWRSLSVTRKGLEYKVSNNKDTNSGYTLNGSLGEVLVFGNQFKGRLARIVILNPVGKKTIRKFFAEF